MNPNKEKIKQIIEELNKKLKKAEMEDRDKELVKTNLTLKHLKLDHSKYINLGDIRSKIVKEKDTISQNINQQEKLNQRIISLTDEKRQLETKMISEHMKRKDQINNDLMISYKKEKYIDREINKLSDFSNINSFRIRKQRNTEIKNLETIKSELEKHIVERSNKKTEIQNEIEILKKTNNNTELNNTFNKVVKELHEQMKSLSVLKSEQSKLEKEFVLLVNKKDALEIELELETNAVIQPKLNQLESNINELESKINELNSFEPIGYESETHVEYKKKNNSSLYECDMKKSELQSELETKKEELQSLEQKLKHKLEILNKIEGQLQDKSKSHDQLEVKVVTLEEQKLECEKNNHQYTSDITTLKSNLKNMESIQKLSEEKVSKFEHKMSEMNETLSKTKDKLKESKDKLKESEEQDKLNKKSIELLDKRINDLTLKKDSLESEMARHKKESEEKINKSIEQIDQSKSELKQSEEKVKELTLQMNNLKNQLKDSLNLISESRLEKDQQIALLDKLKSDYNTCSAKIKVDNEICLVNQKKSNDQISESNKEHKRLMKELEDKSNKIKQELEKITEKEKTCREQYKELETKIEK